MVMVKEGSLNSFFVRGPVNRGDLPTSLSVTATITTSQTRDAFQHARANIGTNIQSTDAGKTIQSTSMKSTPGALGNHEESHHPREPRGRPLPTPIKAAPFSKMLVGYKDKDFIIKGITEGFSLGYQGKEFSQRCNNSLTVNNNKHIAAVKVMSEVSKGRIIGPFEKPPFPNFKCSPLSLREKSTPGKYRLLHDYSFPYDDTSVNANIPESASKVKYATLDEALETLIKYNTPFMAKSDVAEAFRLLPLRPDDYNLTGFKLADNFFADCCLPMGASSSCQSFERFSSGLKYILENEYKVRHVIKVLDDFLFIGESLEECNKALKSFLDLCAKVNIPVAHDKTEGPNRKLVFLGIHIDTVAWTISIPREKICKYAQTITDILEKEKCTLRELKSIIGKLTFVTKIVPAGRCFQRCLHNATIGKTKPSATIVVGPSVRSDLEIWQRFLQGYNGREFLREAEMVTSEDLTFYADASSTGYGSIFQNYYLQGTFPPAWQKFDIMCLELYLIFVMLNIFAFYLYGKKVIFYTDNEPLTHALNNQTAKNHRVMQLLRPLVLILLENKICVEAKHIPGVSNITCDDLSRMQGPSLVRGLRADAVALPVPHHLRPHNLRLG